MFPRCEGNKTKPVRHMTCNIKELQGSKVMVEANFVETAVVIIYECDSIYLCTHGKVFGSLLNLVGSQN